MDEKQLFKNLLKRPYSKQALKDICDAFNDLSGKDRRALMAEFNSSQLGKDFENLSRQFAQATKKLAPQLEAVARFDLEKAIWSLAPDRKNHIDPRVFTQPGSKAVIRLRRVNDASAPIAIIRKRTLVERQWDYTNHK